MTEPNYDDLSECTACGDLIADAEHHICPEPDGEPDEGDL